MSISVLASHRPHIPCCPNHDQLDDLESFYCVIYDLMCSWEGVGQQVKQRPRDLDFWDTDNDPRATFFTKKGHYFLPTSPNIDCIPDFWSQASIDLLVGFYRIVRSLILEKMMFHPLNTEELRLGLRELLETADATYDQVLALFDEALDELEDCEPTPGHPPSGVTVAPDTLPSPSPPPSIDVSVIDCTKPDLGVDDFPRKRRAKCDEDGQAPPPKRSRRMPSTCLPGPVPFSRPRTRAAVKPEAATSRVLRPLPGRTAVRNTVAAARVSAPSTRAAKSKRGFSQRSQTPATQKVRQRATTQLVAAGAPSICIPQHPQMIPLRVTRSSVRAGFHRLES